MRHRTLRYAFLATASVAVLAMTTPGASAITVFDPWNYKENLLTAIRSLAEIDNQVKQLANEAQMLLKMDLDLKQLGSSIGGDVASSLGELKELLQKTDGLALSVSETEREVKRLFPAEYASALSGDESLKLAKDRWDEALAAFKRSMAVEAKVTETSATDGETLADLLSKSEAAVGNLQAQQAGNELVGLNVKQQLQLLTLLATEQRAESLDRARSLAGQEEARLRFQSFLGDGSAYTR